MFTISAVFIYVGQSVIDMSLSAVKLSLTHGDHKDCVSPECFWASEFWVLSSPLIVSIHHAAGHLLPY